MPVRSRSRRGCAAVALHARTGEQFYSGTARWDAIARLKEHVRTIPVLGNGDVWEAPDALRMMRQTGCDGVVVGRGCLGRPWLFRDLAAVFDGRSPGRLPTLGETATVIREHARLVVEWMGDESALRAFRKHAVWYLTGYPTGGEPRHRLHRVASLAELDEILADLDPSLTMPIDALRTPRSHKGGPKPMALPAGWLASPDLDEGVGADAEAYTSGG